MGRGQEQEHSEKMNSKLIVVVVLVAAVSGQEDDFSCPDDFLGFYPHLYSCDKYWSCEDGLAELRTCGNGLAFIDTDPEDCGVFWNCQDGKANRYECPPGLAFDQVSHGCLWASEVPECSSSIIIVDDEGGEFQCPSITSAGIFTKHAHPADCRQYFLCINGVPREQGCPLGEVFNAGSGSGEDGQCTDPEIVPECANYYSDNELDQHRFETTRQDNNNNRIRTGRKTEPEFY